MIYLKYGILKKYLCKQKEIRYLMDRGINKDSIQLYLEMLEDFDL